jgi:hypothetical protein
MKIGRPQGIMVLMLGLILLTGGILVLVSVPAWGDWISGYPAQVAQKEIPAQTAPVVQAVLGIILGPLIDQIGGYMKAAGYFGGGLLTLIALAVSSVGTMLIRRAQN